MHLNALCVTFCNIDSLGPDSIVGRVNYGVFPRTGSPYWWIYYYSAPKKREQESSKKLRADPLGWKQANDLARMKAREHAVISPGAESHFDVWVDEWLRQRLPADYQARSLKTKLMHWRFVRAFLATKNVETPSGVSYPLIAEFIQWRTTVKRFKHSRMATVATEIALLRRVMREAVHRGFVPTNPIDHYEIVWPEPKEKPEITEAEEEAIRAEIKRREGALPLRERWMTISFEIAIRHGWRLAETSFPLDRINFKTWKVMIRQKGRRERTVPLHPDLRPMFEALRADGAKVSCVFPKNSPQRGSYHWSMFFVGCARDKVAGFMPHLCFHCCRVTVISRMLRAGIAERLVMEWVGHASTAVHRIYQRVRSDDLDRCILPSATTIDLGDRASGATRTAATASATP